MTKKDKEEINALIKSLKEESDKEIKHYIGALTESHQHTIDAIAEQTRDIPEIKRTVDMIFENMGKQEVDIEVLKESARDHERRLQKVER